MQGIENIKDWINNIESINITIKSCENTLLYEYK